MLLPHPMAHVALTPGVAHLCAQLLLYAALSIIAPGPNVGHVVFRMPKTHLWKKGGELVLLLSSQPQQ